MARSLGSGPFREQSQTRPLTAGLCSVTCAEMECGATEP
jgi:hypothetical protein